jgi:NADPH-dependent curcumin reductase CurA
MRTTEIRLIRRPVDAPALADFELVTTAVPAPGDGQVLVRNRYMVLSAVMRSLMAGAVPPMPGYQVGQVMFAKALGEVVSSASQQVPVGATVVHMSGWREHAVVDSGRCRVVDPEDPLLHLSSGLTAFVGLRVAGLRQGETVYVSSAAGAVGSMVGQLAKAIGAGRVIGSTGSARKATDLTEKLGFDAAFDYRSEPVDKGLARSAPDGVDVFFDNVGGEQLAAAIKVLNPRGRIALCGALAQQLGDGADPQLDLLTIIGKRLSLHAFTATDHLDWEPEYLRLMRDNNIVPAHTIVDGLDSAPQALLDVFAGRHTGMVIVHLGREA